MDTECNSDFVINSDSLRFVCADEEEIAAVRHCVGDQVSINTYCNFTVNKGFNCLKGKNQYNATSDCNDPSVTQHIYLFPFEKII